MPLFSQLDKCEHIENKQYIEEETNNKWKKHSEHGNIFWATLNQSKKSSATFLWSKAAFNINIDYSDNQSEDWLKCNGH